MKKTNILLSLVLIFSMLCGCTRPLAMQDVKNIVSVDYSFGKLNSYSYYSFDLEGGVFRARTDQAATANKPLDDSPEYELKQSEIENIRNSIESVRKWPSDYKCAPLFGRYLPQYYKLTINYADGTECVFNGSSDGAKWPEGFEELSETFDSIAFDRLKRKVDPVSAEKELTDLLSEFNPVVYRNTDEGYDYVGEGGYSIHVFYGDEDRFSVEYCGDMFYLVLSHCSTRYDVYRNDYVNLVKALKDYVDNKTCAVTVFSDGKVVNKFMVTPDECSKEKLIGRVKSVFSWKYQEELKKKGFRIEGKFADKTKDFVYTVDPEADS